jgi:Protein of unknown function (DUF2927)
MTFDKTSRCAFSLIFALAGLARIPILALAFVAVASPALAASEPQPAPRGAFAGAPDEYTQFSADELKRGFLALAFGSDLRIGARPRGIRRFNHPIRARVIPGGSINRTAATQRIIEEYARKIPNLHLTLVHAAPADLEVRLIDEKDFKSALHAAFGAKVARTFIRRTDPQCMTSVRSSTAGDILRSVSFIIVDKGTHVFLDCAYHELLHAFGLSNHDQHNPWTTLNQRRMVGYLTVYDRALLTALYDPRIKPGMTAKQVGGKLTGVITSRGLAEAVRSK